MNKKIICQQILVGQSNACGYLDNFIHSLNEIKTAESMEKDKIDYKKPLDSFFKKINKSN